MDKNKIKTYTFFVLISILFLPIIQSKLNFFEFEPLKGSYTYTEKPTEIKRNWFSKYYQTQYDKYFNDYLGFRNILVRLNNQIQFSFFDKTSVDKTLVGKDGYLFEKTYIKEYYGLNYVGEEKIKKEAIGLKKIQDYFQKKNIEFIPVILTGKGSYFSEFIPDRYNTEKKRTNYQELVNQFTNNDIFFIDLHKYFLELKKDTKYPLYPKTGIHWTQLGATIGIDTILKTVEKRKNIKLLDYDYSDIKYCDTTRYTDNDIGQAMNLIWGPSHYKMAYPDIKFDTTKQHQKINILMIGDSYCFNILRTNILQNVGSKVELWYYNKGIEPLRPNNVHVKDLKNYIEELSTFDVILLMSSESNFYQFNMDINDKFNNSLKQKGNNHDIDYFINKIKTNDEWLASIKAKAKKQNMPLDSMIYRDAKWVMQNE